MTTTDRERPAANRAATEIDFVLRRAKWRRGPEVLRDMARAQNTVGDVAAGGPNRESERRKRAHPKRGLTS